MCEIKKIKKWFCNGIYHGSGIVFFCLLFALTISFFKIPLKRPFDYVFFNMENDKLVEKKCLEKLIEEGKIITPLELLGQVMSFYESVVSVFGVLMGISCIFGYIYIKNSSEEQVKKQVEEEVRNYIQVNDNLKSIFADILNNDFHLDSLEKKIDVLENKLENELRNNYNTMEELRQRESEGCDGSN
ncbi:MAG: hypothetical protein LBB09_03455 [Rickettsiales bacterium]|nr:hypothetical protein [Rickettsiales bacterium]